MISKLDQERARWKKIILFNHWTRKSEVVTCEADVLEDSSGDIVRVTINLSPEMARAYLKAFDGRPKTTRCNSVGMQVWG